jgi:hypothetical protein
MKKMKRRKNIWTMNLRGDWQIVTRKWGHPIRGEIDDFKEEVDYLEEVAPEEESTVVPPNPWAIC